MKLSDAIRLGAMIRPKARGWFFLDGASCAQGAALEATGSVYNESVSALWEWHRLMIARWPWAQYQAAVCPVCGDSQSVRGMIAHLNNSESYGWTREQIADWVATVEPAEDRSEASGTADAVREVPIATTA